MFVLRNRVGINVDNVELTNPRLLKGSLEAALRVTGTRAQPISQGYLKLHHGQLALASDARVYKDIEIDLALAPGNQRAAPRRRDRPARPCR